MDLRMLSLARWRIDISVRREALGGLFYRIESSSLSSILRPCLVYHLLHVRYTIIINTPSII